MSSVIIPKEEKWYEELHTVAYYSEADLERHLLGHAKHLFPGYYVIPFKKSVQSLQTYKNGKPDLALIATNFKSWKIVEVELGNHAEDHISEQVQLFQEADYNSVEVADYIRSKLQLHHKKDVSTMKLAKLVREEIPSIIVIADKSDLKWRETLKKLGVEIWSFEIYKSARGLHIYRTIGNFPRKPCEDAHCVWSAHIQLTMEVIGNIVIKTSGTSGHISISYEGRQTRWELLVHNLRRYLVFKGGICPLNVNGNYRLVRDKNFNYSFENA